MRLFDSHTHLDFEVFDRDRVAVLERAAHAGVERMLVAGVGPAQWTKFLTLKNEHPQLSFAVGVHPQWLLKLPEAEVDQTLDSLSAAVDRIGAVAIGECGFDGFTTKSGVPVERQAEVVLAQVDVADRASLPVVFHILRAHEEALRFFEKHGPPRSGGVVHSYSGSAEQVAAYEQYGLHISFAASVTRTNARKPHAAAAAVRADRLLVETDAPDQFPTGVSAAVEGRNEPELLPAIARAVADARGEPLDEVAEQTFQNAAALFLPACKDLVS